MQDANQCEIESMNKIQKSKAQILMLSANKLHPYKTFA